MKRFSLLLAAAIVAASAFAGKPIHHPLQVKGGILPIGTHASKPNAMTHHTPTPLLAVTAQPEGTAVTYDRAGQAVVLVNSWNGAYVQATYQGGPDRLTIVYGDDNKVYLKNIVYGSAAIYGDYWVEGTIQGNTIHVPLGQPIYSFEEEGVDVVLGWGTTFLKNDEYFSIQVDEQAMDAIYTINEDGTISLNGTSGTTEINPREDASYLATGLALIYAGNEEYAGGWDGFIEWNTVLSEHIATDVPQVITSIPEGCEVNTYFRNSAHISSSAYGITKGMTNGRLTVAFDQNSTDVYILNPMWSHQSASSWVKGSFDPATGIISIPTGQFLAYDEANEYGIMLGWGSTEVIEDVDQATGEVNYGMVYSIDSAASEIRFQTTASGIFYLLGCEGDIKADFPYNFVATGMMSYTSNNMALTSIEFANRDRDGQAQPFFFGVDPVPAVPANPAADNWYDDGNEYGYSRFEFTLPKTDVNGNWLNPECVSYRLYVDNGNGPELFTFTSVDYRLDLTEDILEVPYELYNSAIDFHNDYVYMYRTNAPGHEPLFTRNIGIQAFYTVDGVKNASDIAWLYDIDTSVAQVNAGKTVASVRYYNVAGQQVAQPTGLTIQVTTYTDGTTSAAKVVK